MVLAPCCKPQSELALHRHRLAWGLDVLVLRVLVGVRLQIGGERLVGWRAHHHVLLVQAGLLAERVAVWLAGCQSGQV